MESLIIAGYSCVGYSLGTRWLFAVHSRAGGWFNSWETRWVLVGQFYQSGKLLVGIFPGELLLGQALTNRCTLVEVGSSKLARGMTREKERGGRSGVVCSRCFSWQLLLGGGLGLGVLVQCFLLRWVSLW